jgi:hypothetical protein
MHRFTLLAAIAAHRAETPRVERRHDHDRRPSPKDDDDRHDRHQEQR